MILGICAHVDAGKTTLSEAMLYGTGQIRSLGRVDHQDAYLDTDSQEKERGITIFSKQARIQTEELDITLLDTPGHVDFSAEMERTLQVLDYAVLVISGTDGVQGHTRTLWRLLRHYHIPTFLFVNKMDLACQAEEEGQVKEKILQQFHRELSDGCVDFMEDTKSQSFYENLAVCHEDLLNEYMENGAVPVSMIRENIAKEQIFPCFWGSALKLEGVKQLIDGLGDYSIKKEYPDTFAARVYKIGHDARGVRLTYLKVLGKSLKVKEKLSYDGLEEKVNELRLYSGDKFVSVDEVKAGEVCVVAGLTKTFPGQGLGSIEDVNVPILEPVLNYQIQIPADVKPQDLLLKLRQIEEEDPQLHILWNEKLQEIHAQMMGQVQIEVLTRLILDRFQMAVVFGQGSIVYKETIARPVEGVGHFEPLRHYAEVHLLLEPGEPGSGIQVTSKCSEDILDLNWQRLIATHVEEREHPGVLTGSVVTDMKVTIVTGRAHNKHTEGGDFRQATYRAIRQGLKSTESVLLEPYYHFVLEVPQEALGRAMTDLKQRFGKLEAPEYRNADGVDFAVLEGVAPVACLHDYVKEVHAYTKGMGHLLLELQGYDVCHNSEEVIAKIGYDSEEDVENPTASVFCAHGAGFLVPWNEVPSYMHMDYVYDPKRLAEGENVSEALSRSYQVEGNTFDARALAKSPVKTAANSWELDKQLQEIYAREFKMSKSDVEDQERKKWMKKVSSTSDSSPKLDKKGNPIYPKKEARDELLIVDGYNIIFAWDELAALSRVNIDSARDKLLDIMSNYQGYHGGRVMVVFDAYKVKGHSGATEKFHNIEVVYTKTDEIADVYIERMVHNLHDKFKITVATNDNLEQLTIMSQGALRMSSAMLEEEIERQNKAGYEEYLRLKSQS